MFVYLEHTSAHNIGDASLKKKKTCQVNYYNFYTKFIWSCLHNLIILYLLKPEQTGPCGKKKPLINQQPRCNLQCLEYREILEHNGTGCLLSFRHELHQKKGLWEPDKSWSKVGYKSNVGSILLISHTCSLEKVIDRQFTAYHICSKFHNTQS